MREGGRIKKEERERVEEKTVSETKRERKRETSYLSERGGKD